MEGIVLAQRHQKRGRLDGTNSTSWIHPEVKSPLIFCWLHLEALLSEFKCNSFYLKWHVCY